MALASTSRPPRILDVLRSLKSELMQCIAAGHSASAILAALRAAGYQYSKSAFAEAWKVFRDENGLNTPKPVIFTPRGTVQRQQIPSRVQHPASITPGSKPPPGSALEALSRPSISQLLGTPSS